MYRKHTQTHIIIPNASCHSFEQKISNINYLRNRLHTHLITKLSKKKELNIIKYTVQNNKYNINEVTKHPNPRERNVNSQHRETKWATFTHNGKETRKITKLFKETQLK
jgi:polynucleotide 5'-kinase involved in rRNA processing